MRKAIVLLNKDAGAMAGGEGEAERERLTEIFVADGLEPEIVLMEAGRVREIVRSALEDHADVVIVGGGDGTVSAAAQELAGGQVPMAVLPLGTRNHLARDLGLPLDLEEAAAALRDAVVKTVDMADVNGHLFINNAQVGAYPRLVRLRERYEKRYDLHRTLARFSAGFRVMLAPPVLVARLRTEDKEATVVTNLLLVGNNAYESTLPELGRRPSLSAGELFVLYAVRRKRLVLIGSFLRGLFSGADATPSFEELRSDTLVVETRKKWVDLAIDGELVRFETPLRFTMRPGLLQVLAPRGDEQKVAAGETTGEAA